jgi:hypothetical protein
MQRSHPRFDDLILNLEIYLLQNLRDITQSTYRKKIEIGVPALSAGSYTTTLYVMVEIVCCFMRNTVNKLTETCRILGCESFTGQDDY